MTHTEPHIPVLCEEVVSGLDIQPDDIVVDGTLGFSGHARAMLPSLTGQGLYIGIDRDQDALNFSKQVLAPYPNVSFHHMTYIDFPKALIQCGKTGCDKMLVDLGVSSWQIDQAERGFSFTKEGPLDMRMNASDTVSASTILMTYSEEELHHIFLTYGELFNPQKLVRLIVEVRKQLPEFSTMDLVALIKKSFYFNNQRSQFLKTCAQVFQALRIEVNQELAQLESFLEQLHQWLNPNGRIAIITFHSLEDRMVKYFFKDNKAWLEPVGKKVIAPTYAQAGKNPRSKSAKLRIVKRI